MADIRFVVEHQDTAGKPPPSVARSDQVNADEAGFHTSVGYTRYALWLLMLVYVINFLDRTIINMLIEPIKAEMHLRDWQLGLLSGFAFGVVYMLFSFPLAVLADRTHRPRLIAICLVVWSGFTALCGLAANFTQLALARAGVGVGEAGCVPAAHALIADSIPRSRRASALAFFALGAPLGQLIGMISAGWLADNYSWREAFFVAAVPGLILTPLVAFTLREPRMHVTVNQGRGPQAVTLRETLQLLARKRAFWGLSFGASVRSFISYGHGPFLASFFYRSHEEQLREIAASFGTQMQTFAGIALGITIGLIPMGGIWLGGRIADVWGAKDLRIYAWMPAVATLILVPIMIAGFLVADAWVALSCIAVAHFVQALWAGPVYSAAQGLVPPQMRAKSSAIVIFIINFFGLILGSVVVGGLSDAIGHFKGVDDGESLRWSLSIIAAPLFWMANRTIRTEMES
jgi:MFS family permease